MPFMEKLTNRFVENGSLGQTLKAFGKFNEKLVASYVARILEGLDYLHSQGVSYILPHFPVRIWLNGRSCTAISKPPISFPLRMAMSNCPISASRST